MTGRERIVVSPSDTLDRLLERVRSSGATELVLDVDERSPLLISLQQLHSLDEVAQDHGVQLTIATTNSKLLNAARVFGLDVIDTRAAPFVSAPAPAARLLAGQPLGHLDLGEFEEEETPETPPPAPVPVAAPVPAPSKPAARRTPLAVAPRPVPKPGAPSPVQEEAEADEEGWETPPSPIPAPPKRARQQVVAPPPVQRVDSPRLDPYGQPYTEDADDEDAAGTPLPTMGRTIRPLRPANDRRAVAAPTGAAEGWDDEQDDYADEELYADERRRRPGLFDGITAFWTDVRAWIDMRRGLATPDDYEDDELAEVDDETTDDGWDEPPYRARVASRQVDVTPSQVQTIEEGEPVEKVETPPARSIRPIALGRGSARVTDEDAFEEAPMAHLRPFVASVTTFDDDEEDFDQAVAEVGWRQRRAVQTNEARGGARFAVGGLLGIILAVVLVLVLALYIFLPTATVTLVARTGTVPVEFNVVVGEIDPASPQGQPTKERIVVPAKRVTVPLKATSSKPATGARLEPDVTAGGPVVLTNPSTSAVTVPKGTALSGTDGRSYVTLEGVTIGPADPFGAGAFGSATVNVAAGIKGSGGNAPIGAVQGQLTSGVYYTNKTAPIAGGSDRRIPTIAQQDLAAAQAAAEAAVRGQGQGALNGALPAGSVIMHDTAGVGNFKVTFSAQAGADGDSVTATVTAETTALVYTPGDIEAQARAEAERRLAAATKPGEPIVAGSTQIDAPQLIEDVPGQLTYKVTANARTRASIGGDAERARLANDLARKSDDEVHSVIAAIPGVSSSTVDYDTGPFPRQMPWLASHITVRIADGR